MNAIPDDAVGITTTLPAEILFAAGRRPVDLNNLFVADENPAALVESAEARGFPQSACAWIKGIYGAVQKHRIRHVVGVVEGDCSETRALLDILADEGVETTPFAYPHDGDAGDLTRSMERLARDFGTTLDAAREWKPRLDHVRVKALDVDTLACTARTVTSRELFESLLAVSDFWGNPESCAASLRERAAALGGRERGADRLRLGCLGVPTILSDLWEAVDGLGARILFHEIPRQFALPDGIDRDLVEAYRRYTYPYGIRGRIEDIRRQVEERHLAGLIHYVQSFCHRQMYDRLLRKHLSVPILTIEADRPGAVDERTRTRLEAFVEQLSA